MAKNPSSGPTNTNMNYNMTLNKSESNILRGLNRSQDAPGNKNQSVYTAVTGTGFLATEMPSIRIYIKIPYSVRFTLQFCQLWVRVSNRVRVSVSFIFSCNFFLSHVH